MPYPDDFSSAAFARAYEGHAPSTARQDIADALAVLRAKLTAVYNGADVDASWMASDLLDYIDNAPFKGVK